MCALSWNSQSVPLLYSSNSMRTADHVISQAINENRVPEYILYGFAITFVVTGEILIGWSMYHGDALSTVVGLALNCLAWPAFRETRRLRQANLMLRTLEIPLSKAQTAEEAAKMLTEAFADHFKGGNQQVANKADQTP